MTSVNKEAHKNSLSLPPTSTIPAEVISTKYLAFSTRVDVHNNIGIPNLARPWVLVQT